MTTGSMANTFIGNGPLSVFEELRAYYWDGKVRQSASQEICLC